MVCIHCQDPWLALSPAEFSRAKALGCDMVDDCSAQEREIRMDFRWQGLQHLGVNHFIRFRRS